MRQRLLAFILILILLGGAGVAQAITTGTPEEYLILVNRHHGLSSTYRPADLIPVGGGQLMRARAANAFLDMQRSMNAENLFLVAISGFRSYETQRTIWNNAVRNSGLAHAERWFARPGHSEHQTGLALDIVQRGFTGGPLGNARFQNTAQFAWLQRNAHHYGFILRYPQAYEHITGIAFEPWHWRYIGVESATYMRENGFAVFESYIEHRAAWVSGPSNWAAEQIEAAIRLGLVPEHLQSGFVRPITRAEFAALVVALYENQRGEITGRIAFIDTGDEAVRKAAYIGVVQGVGGGRFAPSDHLTREQAAVMLARLAEALGQPFPDHVATFYDMDNVSDWARTAVGRVQKAGIMQGVGGNIFAPRDQYTREQSIVTILRLFEGLREADVYADLHWTTMLPDRGTFTFYPVPEITVGNVIVVQAGTVVTFAETGGLEAHFGYVRNLMLTVPDLDLWEDALFADSDDNGDFDLSDRLRENIAQVPVGGSRSITLKEPGFYLVGLAGEFWLFVEVVGES